MAFAVACSEAPEPEASTPQPRLAELLPEALIAAGTEWTFSDDPIESGQMLGNALQIVERTTSAECGDLAYVHVPFADGGPGFRFWITVESLRRGLAGSTGRPSGHLDVPAERPAASCTNAALSLSEHIALSVRWALEPRYQRLN